MLRRTIVTTALLTEVLVGSLRASAQPDSIRFTSDDHGAVLVPVTIDGKGPFRFLLDTGSSRSAITDALASELGLAAVAKTEVVTATSRTAWPVVRTGQVALGRAEAESLLAVVVPGGMLNVSEARADGVLGQDFLGSHNYTLDYRHHTFSWLLAAATEGTVRLPLIKRDDRLLVELPQDGVRVLRLVPDTGTDQLVVFTPPEALSSVGFEARRSPGQIATALGVREARAGVVKRLQLGQLMLRNQPAVAVDVGEGGSASDGLLPLHHFSAVSFEAAGYLVIQP